MCQSSIVGLKDAGRLAGAVDASRGAPGSFLLPTRDGAVVGAGDGAAESGFGARTFARAAATDATVGAEGAGVGTAIGSAAETSRGSAEVGAPSCERISGLTFSVLEAASPGPCPLVAAIHCPLSTTA